jgi:hypothetical protein
MVNKNAKQWVVLYQGEICTIDENGDEFCGWKTGIESQDLTLNQANSLALKLNKQCDQIGYWVAHETDHEVQKHY